MKSKKTLIIFASLIVSLILLAVIGLNVYTYFAEIAEIGSEYLSVVYTNLGAGAVTAVLLFLCSALPSLIWCLWIRKIINRSTLESSIFDKKIFIALITFGIGVLYSVMFTAELSNKFLVAVNSVNMGKSDPVFGTDISYYMLIRPLLIDLREKLNILFIGLLLFSLASYYFYIFRNSGNFSLKNVLKEKGVVTHLCINIALIFLIKVIGYRFTMEDILFSGSDRVGGGYTSVNIWLIFYKIIPFVLLALIIFGLIFLFKSKYKMLLVTVAVYPLCFAIASVSAFAVQQLYVKPNEGSKESKYISYNINATRYAYNLENSVDTPYPVKENLTSDIIAQNSEIINNIRITDHVATLTAYNQLQGIRNFYQFIDADVVPYTENGQRKAAFMSVRELTQTGELEDASYVNQRMKYTHGYGIVKSPVNRVANEGQPDFMIKDIPLSYNNTETKVSQPRIYFGESSNNYFIVNTAQSELDFDETSNEHIGYSGSGGIPLNGFNRLIYAIKKGDINLLTSSYITNESKLLLNHNVTERVKKVAPFLTVDEDVHITIDEDGSLKWIVDCYTKSKYFPYSQYTGDFNYIRNSAKAVVDAYNGTVTFYIIDQNDPIIKTYRNIYPAIFSNEPMPATLKQQIKYPEWLFGIQADIFTKYHITDPAVFYADSDVWAIAREKYGETSSVKNVEPYYNIMTLEDSKPEFVLMLPYTLKNKDNNLVGWLAVQTDNGNYGKFISYSFPAGKHVYGTLQVENKIDNDPEISKEMTLWSQGGSSVMRGNLLVIPINNSLIYVEPLYITSQNEASLPEVKRIIVSYGDKIVMEPTLDMALEKMFGVSQSTPPENSSENTQEIRPEIQPDSTPDNKSLEKAKAEFENLKQAAASGDWESFGKSMKALEEILN